MTSTVRALWISLAFVAVGVALLFWARGCSWNEIGIMKLKVVNDTGQTVQIQPCWDLACVDIAGLPTFDLGPGDARRIGGRLGFENDVGQLIAIGVLKPHAGE